MLILFYLSFILIRLPPILLPFKLTTHILFRLINGAIFVYVFIIKKYRLKINKFLSLSLIFFISQSFSVINAIEPNTFFYYFEKYIFIFLFIFNLQYFLTESKEKTKKTLIYLLVVTVSINALIELLIFFNPLILDFFYKFIHPSVLDIMKFNLGRDRLFFESYGEVYLPVILYFLFFKSSSWKKKVFYLILSSIIFLLAFWSNYRDRFLTFVFSLLGFLIVFRKSLLKINLKSIFFYLISGVIIFIVSLNYINIQKGYSVINRFLLENKSEDVLTLSARKQLINEAIEIGKNHLFFGVGLGHFYDYLPEALKNRQYQMIGSNRKFYQATLLYPHNLFAQIFVETGIIGLLSFLLMLFYFVKKDWKVANKNQLTVVKALIVCFWSVIIYAFFNPRSHLQFYFNFFFLRGLIESYSILVIR